MSRSLAGLPRVFPAPALVRLPLRLASTLLIAVGVATCSDTPPVGVKHSSLGPNGAPAGRVAFQPVFSATALQIAQGLSEFGIKYDRVRVVLVRPVGDTAKDTTIAFTPGGPDITLNLTVEVRSPDEVFDVEIDYLSDAGPVFHGHGRVHSHAPDQPAPPDEQISIDYVGPGANVTRIAISPRTIIVPSDQPIGLVVAAFDANSNPVSTVPLRWTTSDPSVATITSAGSIHALGPRGNVVVTAVTPTGVTDRVNAAVVPAPTSIALIGGGGQRGSVGTLLAAPAVVQVNAADGIGVPGVSVVFSAPVGGHVSVATVETDADGRASAGLTLGTAIGQQLFTAGAGDLRVAIPETASPAGPASITIISGNFQKGAVHQEVAPLLVRVTDQFGNPASGTPVLWARTTGTGLLGATRSTTGADGSAMVTYTLGDIVGTESVTASVSGVANKVVFTLEATAAEPATIIVASGNAQTATVGTRLAAPLVVKVADDDGNPVIGATVSWTATNGTIPATSTTDAGGHSSAMLTLGTHAGPASATATIANGRHATFVATAQPGIASVAIFSTQPASVDAGAPLSVGVTLLDANGNQTTTGYAVAISLANNPSGATLTGTLVRNAVNGVATFNDLKIDKPGTGYTLVASSGNAAPATSSPFSVGAPLGSALTIETGDNQRAAAGSPVPVAPSVKISTQSGNPVAGVSVTFSASDGGVVLPSSAVITDGSGLAAPTSWTLGPHAGPQTLTVVSAGLTSVVIHANAFGGPPAMLAMATQPSATATSGVIVDRQPAIQLQDHFGNPAAAGSLTITVTASSGSLVGTTSISADPVTGMATFADLGILGSGVVTLTFSAPGIQSVTSSPITVSSGGAPTTAESTGARF